MGIGRSERLVGRESELTALRDWLARAGCGPGDVYVIVGEPGWRQTCGCSAWRPG